MAAPPRIARGRAHLGEFEIVALFLTHCGKYSPPFMRKLIALPLIITFGLAAFVQAQPKSRADAETLIATLKFQQGQIVLRNGLATVNVPPRFRYLDGADAKKVLVDLWGNPQRSTSTFLASAPSKYLNLGGTFTVARPLRRTI